MTYYTLVNAVPALQKLVRQDLPLPIAYKLMKTVRKVNEELEFLRMKQEGLRQKHEYQVPQKELDELLSFEIEWVEPKIELPLDDGIRLSGADVEALREFITFKEVNDNAEN